MSLTSSDDGMPNIGGYTLLTVQTDSMEPTIKVGDLIISKVDTGSEEYGLNDVVSFKAYESGYMIIKTHRVVDIENVNGVKYLVTRGDNAPANDRTLLEDEDILAKWEEIRIPGLGNVVDYLQTKTGFFICVLMPMIMFFLYTLFRFVMNTIAYNKETAAQSAKEAMAEFTEEQKQKAIQEYLEQQKNKKE